MALETASNISQLNTSNPASTDGLAQADDHIRLIKSTLQNTFANVTGAVTADQGDLNKLDGYTGNTADLNLMSGQAAASVTSANVGHLSGVTSNIQTQLDTITSDVTTLTASVASAVPTGMIMMWSGAANAIPSGYVLCDGNNSTPDLRDRFVVGAGNSYAVNATGGAANVTLTIAQMPAHTHTTEDQYAGPFTSNQNRIDVDFSSSLLDQDATRTVTSSSTGGGGSHENRPPYYALCYVMKT